MVRTGIDKIAAKARLDSKCRFTSLAHHISSAVLCESLAQINAKSNPGIDGQTVAAAKDSFGIWSGEMIDAIHRRGYRPPPAKRAYIPKPGNSNALRPIAMPTIKDKALQRATAAVLNGIYEQDFLDTSFGGRTGRSAHQAIATVREHIRRKPINWIYEADLKNFFGSLNHGWVERFLSHRVGDPRIITLVRRWLKAGIMEDGDCHYPEEGTVQGGPISVLISNLYLHYTLDLWVEKVVKPRMKGKIFYVRYIDDFMLGFQYQEDAVAFQEAIEKRLAKFSLALEPNKTRLVKFGRFAKQRDSGSHSSKPETLYFLGFTLYCTTTRKGAFKVGMKTEKSRFRRACAKMTQQLKKIRHLPVRVQQQKINQMLRGHYQYYGVTDNWYDIKKFYYHTVRTWRKWLSSRSQNGLVTWINFRKLLAALPLQMPRVMHSYDKLQKMALL